jgi:hypothetical protein
MRHPRTPPPRWIEILTTTTDGELTLAHHYPERFAFIQPIDDLPELTHHQRSTLAEWCYRHALSEHGGTFDPRYRLHIETDPLHPDRLYITGYAFRTTLTHPIPQAEWSRY